MELNQALFDVLGSARTMRWLKPDPVPDEAVERLLWAATRAANPNNTQPWDFVVVPDPAIPSGPLHRGHHADRLSGAAIRPGQAAPIGRRRALRRLVTARIRRYRQRHRPCPGGVTRPRARRPVRPARVRTPQPAFVR